MDKNDLITRNIEEAISSMFPHGAGRAPHTRVRHYLEQIAHVAFREGRNHALLGIMTAADVAEHFGVSERRARALIQNRHERFGVGMRVGNQWLVHRDELPELEPDEKYRA